MRDALIAEALGWTYVGERDVGDIAPAMYSDWRTSDGRIVNAEPPYFEQAVAREIERLRNLQNLGGTNVGPGSEAGKRTRTGTTTTR